MLSRDTENRICKLDIEVFLLTTLFQACLLTLFKHPYFAFNLIRWQAEGMHPSVWDKDCLEMKLSGDLQYQVGQEIYCVLHTKGIKKFA